MADLTLVERLERTEKRLRNLEACMDRVVAEVANKKALGTEVVKATNRHGCGAKATPSSPVSRHGCGAKFNKKQYMKEYRNRPCAKSSKKQYMKGYRIQRKAVKDARVRAFCNISASVHL